MRKMIILSLALAMVFSTAAFAENGSQLSLYYSYLHWKTDLSKLTAEDGSLDLETETPTDQKLNQGVLGLNATGVISERVRVDLRGTLANTTNQLEYKSSSNDHKESLSSLNDTRLRFTYVFGEGKGNGSVFFNLPTGKRELTAEEYTLTAAVADVARKFMVRRYGQGLDVGVDWYALPRWTSFGLTVGGGYLHRGKYQPLKDDKREYKYGDEIFGTLGMNIGNRPVGGSLGVTVRYYTKDKYDDAEVFQAGVATTIAGSIAYSDLYDLTAGVSLLLRGKAKVRGAGDQVLSDEQQKSGRNQLLLYLNGSFPASERMRLLGRFEFTNVSANDYATDSPVYLPKSHYLGLGGGASYSLTSALSASAMASYYTGKIDNDFGLTGLGLTCMLTIQPGQGR